MPKAAPVDVRMAAPELSEEDPNLLYRPVPQLDGKPPYKVEYLMVTPGQADDWLRTADLDQNFRQRQTRMADVRRWKTLILTDRFVHYLPASPVCFDDDGILINGKHRMTAVAGGDQECGFMVVKKVPRWMFAFFDTNRARTLKDVFHINARPTKAQTGSAMRLSLRYEEFLRGKRAGARWRHWNQVKDEHIDVDDFMSRRGELQDWYGVGEKVYRLSKLLVPSVMTFRFYQGLAWPEGAEKLDAFCEALVTGATGVSPQSPVKILRDFAQNAYLNRDIVFAKRELHLLLLMRTFEQYVKGSRIPSITWAYGMPMTMPYHPKGFEEGIKNVRFALDYLDLEEQKALASQD